MDDVTALRHTSRHALLGAGAVLALLVLEWLAVFHVGFVNRLDVHVFWGFRGLTERRHVAPLAQRIADLCDTRPYVVLAAFPLGVALARRRYLLAGAIVAILSGANLTTQLLKQVAGGMRPDGLPAFVLNYHSWPSGHSTAAMALALCAVLAAPARWRPWAAALGAAFAVAVVYSVVTLGWHYPSDTFAGFLVAGLWTLLGISAVSALDAQLRLRRGRSRVRYELPVARALTPPAAALCGVLLAVGLIVAVRPDVVVGYARAHTAFVAGAIVLGALGLTLATGVMMTLRR